jgi:hypothetical protein
VSEPGCRPSHRVGLSFDAAEGFGEAFVGYRQDAMSDKSNDRSVSCAVEVRWFVAGDVGIDKVRGIDHREERVDTYHLESLSESASLKRRGRLELFEEKWRVGAPTRIVVHGVVGHAEAWRKRRTSKDRKLPGPWVDVHKRVWVGRGWEICRLHVAGVRSWTVALSLPADWLEQNAAELAPWWPVLRDRGVAASYPAWLLAAAEELEGCRDAAVGW